MNVLVTDAAWNDMRGITRAIAADNPARAESFLGELFDACQEIGAIRWAIRPFPAEKRRRSGKRFTAAT